MSPISGRRARALASLTALAGLAVAGALTTTAAPAQSADPTGDCAVPFPVADLAAHDPVTGLTVTEGVDPTGFSGEVLGVLDDGIGPGLDMVMVRLSSAEIDRVGIWQGMSGSPVYAEDGRLIGAVAYGLTEGASPVAGVTPFEAMDDYLADAPGRVAVGPEAARAIARASDVTVAEARRGFAPLRMPIGVAGVGAAALDRAERQAAGHPWLPRSTYAVGRASAAAAGPTDIKAGGNLAASMSWGDVTLAGVGTVTSVCEDRVVGFGHPMNLSGATTMGLHPADAIYIQEGLIVGFKVANLGDVVGTITDDRRAGIAGTMGTIPETADLSVALTHGASSRTGVTHIADRTPDTLAWSTFYGILADHQALVDGAVTGSEDLAWTITGTADGEPFTLSSGDRYSSAQDMVYDLGFGMGDVVYALARIPGVEIDSISTDSDLVDAVSTYAVVKVEVRQGGSWVTLSRRSGFTVRGGSALKVRVTLDGGDTTKVLRTSLRVPASFSGRSAALAVVGGTQVGSDRMPRTIEGVETWLEQQVRNDEIVVALERGPRAAGRGPVATAHLRGVANDVTTVLGPVDGVVRGHRFAEGSVR